MSHMTALRTLMMSCIWMTSYAVLPVLELKTFDGVAKDMIGHEMSVRARSAIHCVIMCRTFPHCISAAYDAESSLCFLHPQPTTPGGNLDGLQNSDHLQVLLFTDNDPDCSESSFNVTYESVTTRRSLWSVEGNVTCNDDYYPHLVPVSVTCLSNGRWTPPSPRCYKRIWRYPETQLISDQASFPIPGTVIEGWSMCVDGVPTKNTRLVLQIYKKSYSNIPVHTSWWFYGYVTVNDMVSGSWGAAVDVWTPPFPLKVAKPFFFRLTVNTSTDVDIYMDNKFFYRRNLRLPPSSFSLISIQYDVNLTKVEAWCKV